MNSTKLLFKIIFYKIYDELLYPILIIYVIVMAACALPRLSLKLNSIPPSHSRLNMSLSYRQLFIILQWRNICFWSRLKWFLVFDPLLLYFLFSIRKPLALIHYFDLLIKNGSIVFYVIRTLALVPSPNSLTQALWQLIQCLEPKDSDDLFCLFLMISTSSSFSPVSACNVFVDLNWSSKTRSSNTLTL